MRPIQLSAACIALLLTASVLRPAEASAQSSSLVYEGGDGRLEYATFANRGDDDTVHVVPDYSWAGYKFSEVPIPDVPAVIELEPAEGDNRARIQEALDQIAALPLDSSGFRGALLLKQGYFAVSGGFTITKSGIVIRGEGQLPADQGGTQIHSTATQAHDLFRFIGPYGAGEGGFGTTSSGNRNSRAGAAGSIRNVVGDVASGSHTVHVDIISSFDVGDRIHVLRTPNDKWIDDLDMRQFGWTASGYAIPYERTITAIDSNRITVDVPFVQSITQEYGGGQIYRFDPSFRIRDVGVEDLFLTSAYKTSVDEKHAETAVHMENVEDGWIRRVTTRHYSRGLVTIDWAFRVTVEDCAVLDPISQITGSRRYSFEISKGSFNLFQRNYARNGRHDYVTGSRVTGPNVFVDSYATKTHSDIGPHHRYSTGLLFDNILGGDIRTRNRGASGTGHGWTGGQVMFWNVEAERGFEVVNDEPVGARNWSVGTKGTAIGNALFELNGQNAQPRSLFYRQLEDRVGREQVDRIRTATQRNGAIHQALIEWAGYGPLDPDYAVSTEPSTTDPAAIPTRFRLEPNRPNPFNPTTSISYSVPVFGPVRLAVHTLLGQTVEVLADGQHAPGRYTLEFDASALPSGSYFIRLQAGDQVQTRQMMLVK